MANEVVRTDFIVGRDDQTPALARIGAQAKRSSGMLGGLLGATKRVGGALSGLTGIAGAGGGLLAAMGIHKAIADNDRLMKSIERMKAMTGLSAPEVHAYGDAFQNAGMSIDSTERALLNMSRRAANMGAGTKEAKAAQKAWEKLGVSMEDGPVAATMALAKGAQSGKIKVTDLISKFGTAKEDASDLHAVLARGPEALKRDMDAQLAGGDLVTEQALANHKKMKRSTREVSDAWGALTGIVIQKLTPGLTTLFDKVSRKLESWEPMAIKFGDYLSRNMDSIIAKAITFGKIMAASKAAELVTGKGLGELAIGGVGMLAKARGGSATTAASLVADAAPAVFGTGMKVARVGAGSAGMSKAVVAAGGLGRIAGTLLNVAKSAGRFSMIGAALVVAGGVLFGMAKNIRGLGPMLSRIGTAVAGIVKPLFDVGVKIGEFLAPVMAALLDSVGQLLEMAAKIAGFAGGVISSGIDTLNDLDGSKGQAKRDEDHRQDLLRQEMVRKRDIAEIYDPSLAEARKKRMLELAKRKTGTGGDDERQCENKNNNFHIGKVEIKQEFTKGYDQDRVGTVTMDALIKAGTRPLRSGMTPFMTDRT